MGSTPNSPTFTTLYAIIRHRGRTPLYSPRRSYDHPDQSPAVTPAITCTESVLSFTRHLSTCEAFGLQWGEVVRFGAGCSFNAESLKARTCMFPNAFYLSVEPTAMGKKKKKEKKGEEKMNCLPIVAGCHSKRACGLVRGILFPLKSPCLLPERRRFLSGRREESHAVANPY